MREAQEIEDEGHEQILERVCAIDVAKASGKVCTRVPHPSTPRPGRWPGWRRALGVFPEVLVVFRAIHQLWRQRLQRPRPEHRNGEH